MLHALQQYIAEVERLIRFGGTTKETAIRNAFYTLLNNYARQRGLTLVVEVGVKTPGGKIVTSDGTIKDSLRQDWGYWESKDEDDNLDEEIEKKLAKGYPKDNMLFEDSRVAVLIQNGEEVMRCNMRDNRRNGMDAVDTRTSPCPHFFPSERDTLIDFQRNVQRGNLTCHLLPV